MRVGGAFMTLNSVVYDVEKY